MSCFFVFIFLLNSLTLSTCQIRPSMSLQIFKNIDDTEVPVSGFIYEAAGTNLTLTCKLVIVSEFENDTSDYVDYELSWKRNWQPTQDITVNDFRQLTKRLREELVPLLAINDVNKASLRLKALRPADAETYYCISYKYGLYSEVKLEVDPDSDAEDFFKWFAALDNSRLDFEFVKGNGPKTFPKYLCTKDMFMCKSGLSCIHQQQVCDNVKDCLDGSDETDSCGIDPCEGKKQCADGRCVSLSFCCDKFKDLNCDVNIVPPCCFENILEDHPSFIHPHVDYFDNFNNNYDVIVDKDDDNHNSDGNNGDNDMAGNKWDVKLHGIQRSASAWIVIPCTALLIIIICIAVRQAYISRRNRSRRTTSSSGDMNSNSIRDSLETNPRGYQGLPAASLSRNNLDLPPSYEEAVRNVPPSAPPCDGVV